MGKYDVERNILNNNEDIFKFKYYHVQLDSDNNITAFDLDEDRYKYYIDIEQQKVNKKKIVELKKQLSDTDYQVIKCAEYSQTGLEAPYDVDELHKTRQALRDKINLLENELENN